MSTTGCRPSDDLLRRVQVDLDKQVKVFRERPLLGRYKYLFLDAAWAKDVVGINATHICIMTAVGVTYSGEKEILDFERTRQRMNPDGVDSLLALSNADSDQVSLLW